MNIERAIETLTDYKMESAFEATTDFEDALQLGKEALEGIKQLQRDGILSLVWRLPSETKD